MRHWITLDPFFNWLRGVHDRHARVILAGIATLMLPLMVMTTVATLDNWRQDKDRDGLLECFDQFADASSQTSVAVREASVAKDRALGEFYVSLNAEGEAFRVLTSKLLRKTADADDVKALNDALEDRAKKGRELERKQDALDKARRDNPVPPPPSEFCAA